MGREWTRSAIREGVESRDDGVEEADEAEKRRSFMSETMAWCQWRTLIMARHMRRLSWWVPKQEHFCIAVMVSMAARLSVRTESIGRRLIPLVEDEEGVRLVVHVLEGA